MSKKCSLGSKVILTAVLISTFIPIASWGMPSEERLDQIKQIADSLDEAKLKAGIQIQPNEKLMGPAGSYQLGPDSFLIQYNPNLFNGFSQSARDFILFHEMGHVRLGHAAKPYPGPEAARELEFEADAFATFIYLKIKGQPDDDLLNFFKMLQARAQSNPPGPERIQLIEKALDKVSLSERAGKRL